MASRKSLQAGVPLVSSREHRRSVPPSPELSLQSREKFISSKNPELSKASQKPQPSKNNTTRTELIDLKTRSKESLTLPLSAQQLRSHPSTYLSDDPSTLGRHAASNPKCDRKPNTGRFDDRSIPTPQFQPGKQQQSTKGKATPLGRGRLGLEESPSAKEWPSREKMTDTANPALPKQPVLTELPLDLEDTASPDESTTPTSPGSSVTTLQIHNKLQKSLERNLTKSDRQGFIYVFLDPERRGLLKIGRSDNTEIRQKQIQYTCGLKLQLVHERTVDYCVRAEVLIHHDLLDLCRPYLCEKCGLKHGEWFDVGDEFARTTVNKWVDFIRQEKPYDPVSRALQPFWTHLISAKEPLFKCGVLDIDTLRLRWSHLLSPSLLDRLYYKISTLLAHAVWKFLWKFWWQVNAAGAWTMMFIAFQNHVTFLIMLVSILGSFISMSRDFSQLPKTLRSRKVSLPPQPQ
jgi:hypothetical protein